MFKKNDNSAEGKWPRSRRLAPEMFELPTTGSLLLTDVMQIANLIADAGDPCRGDSLLARKKRFGQQLAMAIGGDLYWWVTVAPTRMHFEATLGTCLVEGGRNKGQQQRMRILAALTNQPLSRCILAACQYALQRNQFQVIGQNECRSLGIKPEDFLPLIGLEDLLLVVCPIENGTCSLMAFGRDAGNPKFSKRDHTLLYIVSKSVDWLHRLGKAGKQSVPLVHLTPRQRQVLNLLLAGETQKDIAKKLGLSGYTVGDYIKQLNSLFHVTSRAQLQAMFYAGQEHWSSEVFEDPRMALGASE